MEDNKDIEKESPTNGGFLTSHIFTLTVPEVTSCTLIIISKYFEGRLVCFLNCIYVWIFTGISCFCSLKVGGGSILSVKISWSQKLLYRDGQYYLDIPFTFPEYVTPVVKKLSKKEKIQLNVNAGTGTEVLCKTASHPLKVHSWFHFHFLLF